MTQTGGEAAERTYRYPAAPRRNYLGGAVLAGLMSAAAAALQFAPHLTPVARLQLAVFTAVFAAVASHAADAARLLRGGVRLSEGGVGGLNGVLVPWSDVAAVEIRALRQRMDVFTAGRRRFLAIRPELDSCAAVQSFIIGRSEPHAAGPPCTVPLLSSFAGAPVGVVALLLAVWSGPRESGLPAALFAGTAALTGLLYLGRRRSIRVLRDGIVLREGWRRTAVPFRDVSAVHVQARPRVGGGAVHYVVLERDSADAIPIAGFRRGYNEAFRCIDAAWRAARREPLRVSVVPHSAQPRG